MSKTMRAMRMERNIEKALPYLKDQVQEKIGVFNSYVKSTSKDHPYQKAIKIDYWGFDPFSWQSHVMTDTYQDLFSIVDFSMLKKLLWIQYIVIGAEKKGQENNQENNQGNNRAFLGKNMLYILGAKIIGDEEKASEWLKVEKYKADKAQTEILSSEEFHPTDFPSDGNQVISNDGEIIPFDEMIERGKANQQKPIAESKALTDKKAEAIKQCENIAQGKPKDEPIDINEDDLPF